MMLHFSGYWKIMMNKFSWVTSSITDIHWEISDEVKQTETYVNNLKEFDSKMTNILKYYTLDSDSLCYQEIKERNKSIDSSNKWYNINYIPLINGSTDLKRTIVCNIYNSSISDIYIEVPYELTSDPISKIALDFIDLYTKKWYKVHMIYKLDKITDLQKHRNVMKFITGVPITSITLVYGLWTNENIDKVYKLLLSLKDFYEVNYGNGLSSTSFNFWVDFKYKDKTDYKVTKIEGIKSWYQIQGFSQDKWSTVENLVINSKNTQIINTNTMINVKDDFFESFWNKKVNFTEELSKYINEQIKLFESFQIKWNLVLNINIKKWYVDVIDWPTINQILNYKNIILITPNSQALLKWITYDEQVERLVKEYENILSEKDILLLYYKYRNLYLESKK